MFKKIVLGIPHSSTEMPFNSKEQWDVDIHDYIQEHTDLHSLELYDSSLPFVSTVRYLYSRFYCDVERLIDDPMGAIGQGWYYTRYGKATRSYKQTEVTEAFKSYMDYQNRLKSALTGDSILIDCHSFSADTAPEVEVCIGFNEDYTRPSDEFLKMVKEHFEEYGYKVTFNNPYSNSISPMTGFGYKSMMIEVNKKLYLTADGELDNDSKLRLALHCLYLKIVGGDR